jgi:hypothetical protein
MSNHLLFNDTICPSELRSTNFANFFVKGKGKAIPLQALTGP